MGSSSTIDCNIKSTLTDNKKKSVKHKFLNFLGFKKDNETDGKGKAKGAECKEIEMKKNQAVKVETLVENFSKLGLERKKNAIQKKEDELSNFSFKKFDSRTKSNSSQDSGFDEKEGNDVVKTEDDTSSIEGTEKFTENETEADEVKKEDERKADVIQKEEELLESLGNLKIEDGKKKKCHLVPVSRGPIRNRAGEPGYHPYGIDTQVNHTVNRQTFSGGQVIVANKSPEIPAGYDTFDILGSQQLPAAYELPLDLPAVGDGSQELAVPACDVTLELQAFNQDLVAKGVHDAESFHWDDIQAVIAADDTDFSDFANYSNDANYNEQHIPIIPIADNFVQPNPIEELENARACHVNYENFEVLDTALGLQNNNMYTNFHETYPTPPSSETVPSPSNNELYSDLLTPPQSETMPSPMSGSGILSPNSDCEKYQEIPPYDDYNNDISNAIQDGAEKKARERNTSTSSLSMKNFKDMQKELAATFSKKECCQITRRPVREIFEEHLKKLKPEKRKDMCLQIASMDLAQIYGTLQCVVVHLSRGEVDESLHLGLFALLCDKVLGTKPELFLGDFGVNILEAAALRCSRLPILARYLVQCIRAVAKQNPQLTEGKQFLFKETDALGDTLVLAVTRGGDTHSDVLSELLRRDPHELPLFNVNHTNIDGNTALHVACTKHSVATSFLHTTHVLLEHGGADIWMKDAKGGDTAVHMAVTSSCQLPLVLALFRHLPRDQWKRLAHEKSRSQLSPLDNARSASKNRNNFPTEVLEFLKKCR